MSLLRKYLPEEELVTKIPSLEGSDEALEEIEYMFYLKLEDFSQLEKAKYKEKQYQWSIKFAKDNLESIVRVRKTVSGSETKYILTSKVDIYGLDGKWELERDVEEHHYTALYELAENGMIKDRYFFPIDGTDLVWEIDVFSDEEGNPNPWVKVDLEVNKRLATIPEFPVDYSEAIINQKEEWTPEEKKFVGNFYEGVVIDVSKLRNNKGPITTALSSKH